MPQTQRGHWWMYSPKIEMSPFKGCAVIQCMWKLLEREVFRPSVFLGMVMQAVQNSDHSCALGDLRRLPPNLHFDTTFTNCLFYFSCNKTWKMKVKIVKGPEPFHLCVLILTKLCPVCPFASQSDDVTCTSEPHVVMQMTVDDLVSLIHNYIQVGEAGILTK